MQYAFAVCQEATLYARAEVVVSGRFFYDDQNTESQNAYTLANFRAGVRGFVCSPAEVAAQAAAAQK